MSCIKSICLSGGGVRGFQLLGALAYLQEIIDFKEVEEFVGTSVGSMLSYLLAIGYTSIEILTFINASKVFDKIKHFNVMQMVQEGGSSSFSPIQEVLEQMTIKKIGCLVSLSQLQSQIGKRLVVVVYNLTKKCKEVITPETHPDIPCITAIRMSSTLPFIFQPYLYGDSLYLDGALVDNFPVELVADSSKTIAIALSPSKKVKKNPMEEFNPVNYAVDILNIPVDYLTNKSIQYAKDNGIKLIDIESTSLSGANFNLTTTTKLDLFSNGYNAAKDQYLK